MLKVTGSFGKETNREGETDKHGKGERLSVSEALNEQIL